MSEPLRFVSLIVEAFGRPDPRKALSGALAEIAALRDAPGNRLVCGQFERFMNEVALRAGSDAHEALLALLPDIADGSLPDAQAERLREIIKPDRDLQEELKILTNEFDLISSNDGVRLVVEATTGRSSGSLDLNRRRPQIGVKGIMPGKYTLRLATGWLIWEGAFTSQDLLWTEAYPGRPLKLAADTGAATDESTRQIDLLDGELTLRVFAGVESGRLELQWRTHGGPKHGR